MFKIKKLVLPVVSALVLSTTAISGPLSTSTQIDNGSATVQTNPLAPGIIIKYKTTNKSASVQDSMQRAEQLSATYGINLHFKRMMSGDAEVLSIDTAQAKALSSTDLQDIVAQLNARDDVEFAEIDAWMVPYFTPNDTAYNTQWHYHETVGGMRLPAAWDTTRGTGAVVAVLDTGYRPHSDLAGNVIGQYDMISSSSVAGDGGGRDSNAQDPGDFTTAGQCGTGSQASNSSWHGTHVAGTVAAITNNNNAVAGVAGSAKLVPVRVLGRCGGSLSDIADGIRWAAGLSVSGVPSNPNPADVINMSLGSSAPAACSSSYQSAITAAVNAGTTVVVAAGNDNSSAGYPPANCTGVISVAATNRKGGRAYYSNYGSSIDVAAPGGDGCNPIGEGSPTSLSDCEGGVWSEANMIQSTYNTGTTTPGSDSIGALQGTSMAAPHVAGVAALMRAHNPSATPAEIEAALKSSARTFPTVSSHQCTTSNCGAGIVDANAALVAIAGSGGGGSGSNVLANGVAVTGLSDSSQGSKFYTLDVPAGASNLSFTLSGGTGDADLYVKFGSNPTTSNYDCRSWASGNNETCNIANAQAGTYHVLVYAYAAYSGASLTGSFTGGGGNTNVAPTAAFTSSCTDLTCSFNGSGSTDSDGSIASYSWSFGATGATASNTFASAGTYTVTLTVTDNGGLTDSISKSVTVTAPPPTGSVLTNGVAQTGLSASLQNQLDFTMVVPAGATNLSFTMSGGTGDADLYVRFGSAPTLSSYDCRPYIGGNSETCTISNVQAGTYHVMVYAYAAYSGVSLTGSYTAGGGTQQSLFSSTTNVSIPDNNPAGATSNISVNRTGNAGTVKITYSIVHTYIGDLTVKLIAPDGTTTTLRNPSGGSANNITNATINVNASSSNAAGTWKLKVIDGANIDTGYIDSWSIEFL